MKNKKVSFKNYIRIYLIPIYYEIENYQNLWWTKMDRMNSMVKSNEEIFRLLAIHPFMNSEQAIKLLYQPNNISYNPDNFL